MIKAIKGMFSAIRKTILLNKRTIKENERKRKISEGLL